MSWPADTWWEPQRIVLPDGTGLAVRCREGAGHGLPPVLLVHGLASNALLWRGVADALHERGHPVAVVDLRGHGRSDRPQQTYSTAQSAADLHDLVTTLGWDRLRPVIAGQSWGGNVAVRAAAQHGYWGGVLAVDGGWIDLSHRFDDFEACWTVLAPPGFGNATPDDVVAMLQRHLSGWPPFALESVAGNLELLGARVTNRLSLEHHRSIVHSLWSDSPFQDHPVIQAPTHLLVAGRSSSAEVDRALELLPDATVSWHPEAHHDIHLQHPELVVDQLLGVMSRMTGSVDG